MSFDTAYPLLMREEGKKLEDVPGDSGGLTFCGITMGSESTWPGWPLVRADVAAGKDPTQNPTIMRLVSDFYRSEWVKWQIDALPAELQIHVFGCAVNEGAGEAFKILRAALTRQGFPLLGPVAGIAGPGAETLAAVDKAVHGWLLDSFCWMRTEVYDGIAEKHANDRQFLCGWISREISGL